MCECCNSGEIYITDSKWSANVSESTQYLRSTYALCKDCYLAAIGTVNNQNKCMINTDTLPQVSGPNCDVFAVVKQYRYQKEITNSLMLFRCVQSHSDYFLNIEETCGKVGVTPNELFKIEMGDDTALSFTVEQLSNLGIPVIPYDSDLLIDYEYNTSVEDMTDELQGNLKYATMIKAKKQTIDDPLFLDTLALKVVAKRIKTFGGAVDNTVPYDSFRRSLKNKLGAIRYYKVNHNEQKMIDELEEVFSKYLDRTPNYNGYSEALVG